jgi:uncharacterized LabA/DUF88 family protein
MELRGSEMDQEGIALFIDGANLHRAAKSLGFEIDYKLLLAEFQKQRRLLRAYFYNTISETGGIRSLVNWLDYNGFTVKAKPAKEFDDGEGRRKIKRNIDVELAVDALSIVPYVDMIFLFSGNHDLHPLVGSLQRQGVRVIVISSALTAPSMIDDDLRRKAGSFIELNNLHPSIERSHFPVGGGIARR